MTHSLTGGDTPPLFTRHDFDQAITLFQRVNQDSQGQHPEYDDDIKTWLLTWIGALPFPDYVTRDVSQPGSYVASDASQPGDYVASDSPYYIALPVDDAIVFSPPDATKGATIMPWLHAHPLLLVGVAVLINLSECNSFTEVSAILHYLRGQHWIRYHVAMTRPTANLVRDNFYQTLRELIQHEN